MEASALTRASVSGLRGPSALLRLQSDERLIALTRDGQHAAFEILCSRYQSRLLSFCRHMLGSREDAEDVLQEVFAAAFNAVLADEREINVRPWLYRIARNRSLNHLRRASAIGLGGPITSPVVPKPLSNSLRKRLNRSMCLASSPANWRKARARMSSPDRRGRV